MPTPLLVASHQYVDESEEEIHRFPFCVVRAVE
jgi:hypothetical protein